MGKKKLKFYEILIGAFQRAVMHSLCLFCCIIPIMEFLHLAKNTEQIFGQLASSEILRKTKVILNSSLT